MYRLIIIATWTLNHNKTLTSYQHNNIRHGLDNMSIANRVGWSYAYIHIYFVLTVILRHPVLCGV